MGASISRTAVRVRRVLDRPVALDLGLMTALFVTSWLLAGPQHGIGLGTGDDAVSAWVAVVELLAVPLWRRFPVVTFVVGLLGALVHLTAGFEPVPADGVVLLGLYAVTVHRGRRLSVALLALVLVVLGAWDLRAEYTNRANTLVVQVWADGRVLPLSGPSLSPARLRVITQAIAPASAAIAAHSGGDRSIQLSYPTEPPALTWGGFWVGAVVLLLVWSAGNASRRRRVRAAELERQRDTQARLAVADERARISRELHDVVAHGLSVVVLQAQGGAAALEHRPERTRAALAAIVTTGRQALAETRRLLGALGDEESEPVRWAPQPGMARVPELCARVRATGVPVELRIDGDSYLPPAAVDLAAYRIVQEALTNIMKHAGDPATATVVLRYGATELAVEVANGAGRRQHVNEVNGTPTAELADRGTGLRGMRERATVLGGSFHAGPDPEGGFVVRATLPLEVPPA